MKLKTQSQEPVPEKRTAALRATLALIAEQGLEATPMSQVAERANIGVGTIYRYFSNKEDLINALYIDLKAEIARFCLRDYAEDVPAAEGIKRLLRNVIFYYLQNPAAFLFVEQYENSPQITAHTREEGDRLAAPIEQLFVRASEEGLLKDLPIAMLGGLMSGAVIGLAKLYLQGQLSVEDGTLEAGLDAIWDAIRR